MFREVRRPPRGVYGGNFSFCRSRYQDEVDSLKQINKKLANHQSPIEWDFVRLHLEVLRDLKRYKECFYDDVYDFLHKLFKLYQCKDFSVIADTIQLQCFICEFSYNSLRKIKTMQDIMMKNKKCSETNGLNYVAQLMKMPYKKNNLPYHLLYDVIQLHIVSVERMFLKYLLKYGVMYIQLSDHRTTWTNCHKRLSLLLDEDVDLLLDLPSIQAKLKRLSPETRRRMLAVFRGVEVILRTRLPKNFYYKRDFALCFRMAYETIPEPIITSNEVVNFLECVLSGPFADILIEEIREDFEYLFPESREPLAPRTLKHLARCQVRQNLREKSILPFSLSDATLPTAIKNYITSFENDYLYKEYRQDVDFYEMNPEYTLD